MEASTLTRIRSNPHFAELERRRNRVCWTLSAIMVAIYGLFIALVAFAPRVMATRVAGVVTLGLPFGLGVILVAIALTGFYVWLANREFDRLTALVQEAAR